MNPWKNLVKEGQDYVLAEDKPFVDAFNSRLNSQHEEWKIQTKFVPEPRLGPINAPVVVLQLNPSYDKESKLSATQIKQCLNNLQNENSPHTCIVSGNSWWERNFRQLIKDIGSKDLLAKRICSIEYFPYPSQNFCHANIRLPSQIYTFNLVRRALKRNALILVTRGLNIWLGAVPELGSKLRSTVFETKNPRKASISKGNLPRGVYSRVLDALS